MDGNHPKNLSWRKMLEALHPYIKIARVDHWIKNIFIFPGVFLALFFTDLDQLSMMLVLKLAIGCITVCITSSANYVINEYLDRETDKHHPVKKYRFAAQGKIDPLWLALEYLSLCCAAILMASLVNHHFLFWTVLLLVMGIVYNVRPIRLKDVAYADVIVESVNNPIRFMLGWSILLTGVLPPITALLAYWLGGCFLMNTKRLAEYRTHAKGSDLTSYRKSFRTYTEGTLLTATLFYSMLFAFFCAIFLLKYKIEFLVCFPLYTGLFCWYFVLGLRKDSIAERPEKLTSEKYLLLFAASIFMITVLTLWLDIPILHKLQLPLEL